MRGRLNLAQRDALAASVEGKVVYDLGCAEMALSSELLDLGASRVVAVDKEPYPSSSDPRIEFVQSYFDRVVGDRFDFALLSWPVNWHCMGLIGLLSRFNGLAYLGKNTDGISCGSQTLFTYLSQRDVVSYVPDRPNTLIVYGQQSPNARALCAEEWAGLQQEGPPISYSELEGVPSSGRTR